MLYVINRISYRLPIPPLQIYHEWYALMVPDRLLRPFQAGQGMMGSIMLCGLAVCPDILITITRAFKALKLLGALWWLDNTKSIGHYSGCFTYLTS